MARGSQEGLSATSLGVTPRGSFGLPEPMRSPRFRFKLFPDMLALYTMKTLIIRYFQGTKDHACGGFGRRAHVDFLEIKNKVGLASRKQNRLGGTDPTGQRRAMARSLAWLGSAWLAQGSHLIRKKVRRSSGLDLIFVVRLNDELSITVYLSAPGGDRYPEASYESANGAFSVFPECSDVFGDYCDLHLSKMSPEGLSGGACFWVLFTCPWIERPGSPIMKASANVRECPSLSRRLLKCARRCHWSFEITVLVTRVYNKMIETHQWIRKGFADEPAPEKKRENIAVRATSACSRCRPIPWIVQGYARTSKKPKNRSVCPECPSTDPNVDSRRGPHARDLKSRGLGVSTFPWGRVIDTREKESPLIILRPESRGLISYPGSRGMEHLVIVKALVCAEPESPCSGVHVTCGPISRTPFRYSGLLGLHVILFIA
ncbi:hypothetical protein CRG98_003622 [Punica granatum]|uniref:Uncharacterized protein n=1 Tax=Punica granatum TaxID=22663 RepID=A0A2I0L5J5_PUNGR|nr:hypothetical protein CRG98_003622 [Punica granatum]